MNADNTDIVLSYTRTSFCLFSINNYLWLSSGIYTINLRLGRGVCLGGSSGPEAELLRMRNWFAEWGRDVLSHGYGGSRPLRFTRSGLLYYAVDLEPCPPSPQSRANQFEMPLTRSAWICYQAGYSDLQLTETWTSWRPPYQRQIKPRYSGRWITMAPLSCTTLLLTTRRMSCSIS